MMLPPVTLISFLIFIDQLVTRCADSRSQRRYRQYLAYSSPSRRHTIKLRHDRNGELRIGHQVLPAGRKEYTPVIRRKAARDLVTRIIRQPPGLSARRRHNKYIHVAIPVRSKRYPPPIMGPY